MSGSGSVRSTLVWYLTIFLLAAAVTAAVFFVFIPGPERKLTFYVALSLIVAAEFIYFGHLLHARLSEAGIPTATAATRVQVQVAIVLWLITTIILGAVAVNPDRADTFTADKLLVIDLVLTFLLLACAYFLYSRDTEVQTVTEHLAARREISQAGVPDLEQAMKAVTEIGRRSPQHAVQADRVAKRIDTARSAVEAIIVSERAAASEPTGEDWDSKMREQIARLIDLSAAASGDGVENVPEALERIAGEAEDLSSLLKRRDRSLSSGGGQTL